MPLQSFSVGDDDDDDPLDAEDVTLLHGGKRGAHAQTSTQALPGILMDLPPAAKAGLALAALTFVYFLRGATAGAAPPAGAAAGVALLSSGAASSARGVPGAAPLIAQVVRPSPSTFDVPGSSPLILQALAAAKTAVVPVPEDSVHPLASAPAPGPPAPAAPAAGPSRGLLANGDELKWAEDTFGLFLKDAVPRLEEVNNEVKGFFNQLATGDCDKWSANFAETGTFNFNLPAAQEDLTTREQVKDLCVHTLTQHVIAVRLVWNFPDMARLSGMNLFEVFARSVANGQIEKTRWASFARMRFADKGPVIEEFRLYNEASFWAPASGVVQANMKRLNTNDCDGFESALPAVGVEKWQLQSLPLGVSKAVELDNSPRDQIIARCREDTERDSKSLDFQHSSQAGVFPSARDEEAMVFFHKERRYKGTVDVSDDPEGLIITLGKDSGAPGKFVASSLSFFTVEGVHLVQEWSWKYGWESKQK